MTTTNRNPFLLACLLEVGLLLLGAGLALVLRVPVLELIQWRFAWALIGLAGTVPLAGLLIWIVKTSWTPVTTIRRFIDEFVKPLLEQLNIFQLLLLAILAGLAEEFFFRAFLQTWLSGMLGPAAGIVLASLVFGACHLVTRFYGIFATLMGAYLGAMMLLSGSFWPPAITHALYDFLALIWLLKIKTPTQPSSPTGSQPEL